MEDGSADGGGGDSATPPSTGHGSPHARAQRSVRAFAQTGQPGKWSPWTTRQGLGTGAHRLENTTRIGPHGHPGMERSKSHTSTRSLQS